MQIAPHGEHFPNVRLLSLIQVHGTSIADALEGFASLPLLQGLTLLGCENYSALLSLQITFDSLRRLAPTLINLFLDLRLDGPPETGVENLVEQFATALTSLNTLRYVHRSQDRYPLPNFLESLPLCIRLRRVEIKFDYRSNTLDQLRSVLAGIRGWKESTIKELELPIVLDRDITLAAKNVIHGVLRDIVKILDDCCIKVHFNKRWM